MRDAHFYIVVERDPETGLFVGSVPGWPGAHSQGETLDELRRNLQEAIEMLLENGEPKLESQFVGCDSWRCGSAGLTANFDMPMAGERLSRFMEVGTSRQPCSGRLRVTSV